MDEIDQLINRAFPKRKRQHPPEPEVRQSRPRVHVRVHRELANFGRHAKRRRSFDDVRLAKPEREAKRRCLLEPAKPAELDDDLMRLLGVWQNPDDAEHLFRRSDVLKARKRYSVSFDARLSFVQESRFGQRHTYFKEVNLVEEKRFNNDRFLGPILDGMVETYREKNDFRLYELEVIWIKRITVTPLEEHQLENQLLKGTALHYKFLGDLKAVNKSIGQCVLDFVLYELQASGRLYTRERLVEEFGGITEVQDGITTSRMMQWAREKGWVSLWALDPFFQVFNHVISSSHHTLVMVFIVNNGHCYPVLDEEYKRQVSSMGRIELDTTVLDVKYESYHFVALADIDANLDAIALGTIGDEKVVLVEQDNLSRIIGHVSRKSQLLVSVMRMDGHRCIAFEHPLTGKIVLASQHHNDRVQICKRMFTATRCAELRFSNQSYAKIAEAYLEYLCGEVRPSEYSSSLADIFDKYRLGPVITQFHVDAYSPSDLQAFDLSRCYTSVLLHNSTPWPVFSAFDHPVPWVDDGGALQPGEYVVALDCFMMGNGTIRVPGGPLPSCVVAYAIANGYIRRSDISHWIKPSRVLPADVFQPFVESVIEMFEPEENEGTGSEAKMLINTLIGLWNSQSIKSSKGAVTDSYEVAMSCVFKELERGRSPRAYRTDDLFFVESEYKERKQGGHVPIYRAIIANSWIALDRLQMAVCGPETTVVSYNTDSIKVLNPRQIEIKDNPKPGDIRREKTIVVKGRFPEDIEQLPPYVYVQSEWTRFHEQGLDGEIDQQSECKTYEEILEMVKSPTKSCLVSGMAGSGKTHLIQAAFVPKESVALVHSNLSADNLRMRGVDNVFTFDTFFPAAMAYQARVSKLAAYRYVFVDEYGNLPSQHMSLLARIKRSNAGAEHPIVFRLFGEMSQIPPVEEKKTGVYHDYDKSPLVCELCDQQYITIKYRFTRFDLGLYNDLMAFKRDRRLPVSMRDKKLVPCYTNICYTNDKRKEINDECLVRFTREFPAAETRVIDDITYVVGMPLIAITNVRSTKPSDKAPYSSKIIYNSQRFRLLGFNEDSVSVCLVSDATQEPISIANRCLKLILESAFAVTAHKMQGSQIEGPYAIHELSRMSFNCAYVALSRGIALDRISLDWTPKRFKLVEEKTTSLEIGLQKAEKIITGCVYLITDPACEGDDRWNYIGSTILPDVETRMDQHRLKPTNAEMARVITSPTATITVLERITCLTQRALHSLENEYIARHNESITGVKLLNIKCTKGKKAITKVMIVRAPLDVQSLSKFAIRDDTENHILSIRGMVNGRQTRWTKKYAQRGREVVYAEAQAFRLALLEMYK
jgi:hypothetical protein